VVVKVKVRYELSVLCHNTRMIILALTSTAANLENSGGKGASLARLRRLELPVPPGFIVTTEGYRQYIAANHLEEEISASLAASPEDDGRA
jgi:phosphoenolpyruvate synthase/pyruvate phosphate dikinase